MATTATTSIRNVYGTGVDLQNAKNSLGATGGQFNYIDTGKAGYTGPTSYSSNDVVLGGTGTVGGVAGDVGTATRLGGANATDTANIISQYAQPLTYVNQVNNAISQSQASRGAVPTYDYSQDVNSINQSYADQQKAGAIRIQGATDAGVANLNYQTESAKPQYQVAKNQVDVVYNQQQNKATEQLASQGLNKSGKSLTSSAILSASRVNQIGALTTQEQKMVDDANFQINQLKQAGATEQNAQILELEGKKTEALMQARQRKFENDLSTFNAQSQASQQDLTNMISGVQMAYGVSKDQAATLFQNKQFDAQQAQVLAETKFKESQFTYQQAQDAITKQTQDRQITNAEAQQKIDNAFRQKQEDDNNAAKLASLAMSASKASSSGSKASASAGAKAQETDINNRMWSQFYDAQSKGVGDQWLADNRANILASGSTTANTIYQSMYTTLANAEAEKQQKAKSNKGKNLDANGNPVTQAASDPSPGYVPPTNSWNNTSKNGIIGTAIGNAYNWLTGH